MIEPGGKTALNEGHSGHARIRGDRGRLVKPLVAVGQTSSHGKDQREQHVRAALSDPDAPGYALRQPDYYSYQIGTLAVGQVPGSQGDKDSKNK